MSDKLMPRRILSPAVALVFLLLLTSLFPVSAQDINTETLPYLEKTLTLGKGDIHQVTWSPDGKQLLIATSWGVFIHDMENNAAEIERIQSPFGVVWGAGFNADGDLVALAGYPKLDLRGTFLWNITTGESVNLDLSTRVLEGEQVRVIFSPDKTMIITYGLGSVSLWDSRTGALKQRIEMESLFAVDFSADSSQLVLGIFGDPFTVHFYDIANGSFLKTVEMPAADLAYSPAGNILAGSDLEGRIEFHSLDDNRLIERLNQHDDLVVDLDFTPDGEKLVSVSRDNTLRLWNVDEGRPYKTLSKQTYLVIRQYLGVSPDGRQVAVFGEDGTVRVLDMESGDEKYTLDGFGITYEMAISSDGRWLATGQGTGVTVWDMENPDRPRSFGDVPSGFRSLAFSDDARLLAIGGYEYIEVWNIERGGLFKQLSPNGGRLISALKFSPDRKWLVSGGGNGGVYLWNMETGRSTLIAEPGTSWTAAIHAVAWSPDSRYFAAGGFTGEIFLWDVESDRMVATMREQLANGQILSLTFNHAGDTLAVGVGTPDAAFGGVRLYNTAGRLLAATTLSSLDTTKIDQIAFTEDDSVIVAAPYSRPLLFLDVATLALIAPVDEENRVVLRDNHFAFIPGTTLVVSGDRTGILHFWDFTSGELLTVSIDTGSEQIHQVVVSPDGSFIAVNSLSSSIGLWKAPATLCLISPQDVVLRDGPNVAFPASGTLEQTMRVTGKIEGSRWVQLHDGRWAEVSSLSDGCTDVPVIAAGDSDADAIDDILDNCPLLTSTDQRDLDSDGFGDACDVCPESAGEFMGCADTDGDSVPDTNDQCPGSSGLAEFSGCFPAASVDTQVNLRPDASTDFPAVGKISANDAFVLIGRNQAGDWVKIRRSEDGLEAWIFGELIITDVDLSLLPEVKE